MTASTATYAKLVAKTPPKIVRTEEQNEYYIKALRGFAESQNDKRRE